MGFIIHLRTQHVAQRGVKDGSPSKWYKVLRLNIPFPFFFFFLSRRFSAVSRRKALFTLTLRGASSVLRIKRVVWKPVALAPFLSPSSLAQSPEFPRVIDTLRKGLPSATHLNVSREKKQRCYFLVATCSSFADYGKAFFYLCSVGAP